MLLPIHVAAGGLALVLVAVALLPRKGGTTHRRSGRLLVYALLVMGISASTLAARPSLASRVLDGRGSVLEDRDMVVRDGRIADIVSQGGASTGTVHADGSDGPSRIGPDCPEEGTEGPRPPEPAAQTIGAKPESRMRSSRVSMVAPVTRAVATMIRSAGSR